MGHRKRENIHCTSKANYYDKRMINNLLKQDKKVDWELFISRHQEYSPGFSYLIFASMTPAKWFQEITGLSFALKYSKRVGDNYYWSISESRALQELLYKS